MSVAIWYQSYPSINRHTYCDHFQLNEDEDCLHFFHQLYLLSTALLCTQRVVNWISDFDSNQSWWLLILLFFYALVQEIKERPLSCPSKASHGGHLDQVLSTWWFIPIKSKRLRELKECLKCKLHVLMIVKIAEKRMWRPFTYPSFLHSHSMYNLSISGVPLIHLHLERSRRTPFKNSLWNKITHLWCHILHSKSHHNNYHGHNLFTFFCWSNVCLELC